MARNNYSYEKRKREIEKKKKKEAKKQKKLNKTNDEPIAFDEFGLPIEAPPEESNENENETDEDV